MFVVGLIALAFALFYEDDLNGTQEEVVFITTWTLVLVGPVMASAGAFWLQRKRRGRG